MFNPWLLEGMQTPSLNFVPSRSPSQWAVLLTYKASPLLFPLFQYVNHLWRWPCKHSQKCALLISHLHFNPIQLCRPYSLTPHSDSARVSCGRVRRCLTSFFLLMITNSVTETTPHLRSKQMHSPVTPSYLLPQHPSLQSISVSVCFSLLPFPSALCKRLQHLVQETCFL